jgi:hypothetical protein
MRRGLVEMGGGTANPAAIPSDPLFFPTLSGGLSSLWHLEKIQAPAAWAFSTGKKTVRGWRHRSLVPRGSGAAPLPGRAWRQDLCC